MDINKAEEGVRVCEAGVPALDQHNKPLVNSWGHAGIAQRSSTPFCQAFYFLVHFSRCQNAQKMISLKP